MIKKIVTAIIIYFLLVSQCLAGSVQRYSINQTGLIGWWKLDAAGYDDPVVWGWAGSKNLTAVSNPNLTTGHDGRANTAISFDGTADYLALSTVATNTGTVSVSTADGYAYLIDSGKDFTSLVGSSTPNYVVVSNGTYSVGGYLKALGGGETLAAASNYNGDVELGTTAGWQYYFNAGNGGAGSLSASSSVKYEGAYGINFAITGQGTGVSDCQFYTRQNGAWFTINQGYRYKLTFWIKGNTTGNVQISVNKATSPYTNAGLPNTECSVTTDWVQKTYYFTALATYTNDAHTAFRAGNRGFTNIYVDNAYIQQVTDPAPPTGVQIVSVNGGATQNLAWTDASFNPNGTLTYSVYPSDYQWSSSQAFTVAAWVKPNGVDENGYIITKKDFATASMGWGVFWNGTMNALQFYYGLASVSSSAIFTENNTWVHIAISYNGSGSVSFYKNGVFDRTATGISFTDSYFPLLIGTRVGSSPPLFSGSIDNVLIYNRALTAIEVLNLYHATARPVIIDQSKSWRIQ